MICPAILALFEWHAYCIALVVVTADRPSVWSMAVCPLHLISDRLVLFPNCMECRVCDALATAWLLALSDWPLRLIAVSFDMIVHRFAVLVVFVAIELAGQEHHLQ